jgi:poly-beta-1,6-N-acetyl-D-glucosamine biosynthesis protein PgaD
VASAPTQPVRADALLETPSRPRRPLIIERPDLQTTAQRLGYLTFTFAAWFAWFYLVIPLVGALAWAVGLTVLYRALVSNLATADLVDMVKVYGTGIGILSTVFVAWAVFEYRRWRHVERRRASPLVDDPALAHSHRVTLEELAQLRHARRCVLPPDLLLKMFPRATTAPPPLPDAACPATSPDAGPSRPPRSEPVASGTPSTARRAEAAPATAHRPGRHRR